MTLSKRVHASGKMSTVDVAKAMGVQRSTVWLWIKNGALKAEKIGHFIAIDPKDLASFRAGYHTSSSPAVSPTVVKTTKKSSAKGKSRRSKKEKS